jgi:lipid II:glycine glycyltransferase (peptidoglycan interpeptide bridge formation enzyme)
MIEITDSIDVSRWEAFVLSQPQGNVFQSSMMTEAYRKTRNYNPVCLAAVDSASGDILAVMQATIISEFGGLLSAFSSRSILQGGPLFVDSPPGREAVRLLVEHYNRLVGSKAVYTQIRNMWDTEDSAEMLAALGYEYDQHLDFLIDLDRNKDDIWQDIHKSRRKGINRAEKNGMIVRKVSSMEELTACYDLVDDTYKRFKVPIADISLFRAVYEDLAPTGFADFFIAVLDNEAVGTRITLNYKDMVYDWYAGSKPEIDYVDELLVWHVLKENAGKYKIFDFGGAGHPHKPYGVREFKRRFGGEMVNFGRYEKVHSRARSSIAGLGFSVYKKLLV